ncbi:MAG: ABC transporter permease [Bryobacteraceae bacterium]|nr:ABC transporter permease [Bryobacteraceae bacterium]MDW8378766.1 ABC transporter permease [Bryobacterales bacterium]
MSIGNIWILCKKELKSYFASPIAYGLMAFFALVCGYFFYAATAIFVVRSTDPMMAQRGMPMDVTEWVIRPVLMNASVLGLFMIPMITMRLFAEEKRSGTIELLATSPIRDIEIILGKWLAAVLLYVCILAVSAIDLSILFIYGKPEVKPLLVGYLGLLLQGSCLLAIGTFISNTTRHQLVAGAATFAVCLLLWVLDWVSAYDSTPTGRVISYLSVMGHFENFAKGVLDSKDVIYYLSVIFFGLFLTTRSMEYLRWRA